MEGKIQRTIRRRTVSWVEMREFERQIWFFGGALIHGFNIPLLEEIYEKYREIDAVPTHYHYPSLYEL